MIDNPLISPYFIAEVSSNHHRDLERCLNFIDKSAEIGCDAVKFQLFKIDKLFAPEILDVSEHHRKRSEWELPTSFLPELTKRCHEKGIQFSCTPFYIEAVEELLPYVDFYKIASYELLWDELLIACAKTGKPVVLSTGMATLDEISHAVTILKKAGCDAPVLLHCVSGYPTPVEQCNLAAIETIRNALKCQVGWSDHSVSPVVLNRAMGHWDAQVIEFHLDLDKHGEEYGAGHCWLPEQIAPVIRNIRESFSADGTGIKSPVDVEMDDREWRADPVDGLRPMQSIRKKFVLSHTKT